MTKEGNVSVIQRRRPRKIIKLLASLLTNEKMSVWVCQKRLTYCSLLLIVLLEGKQKKLELTSAGYLRKKTMIPFYNEIEILRHFIKFRSIHNYNAKVIEIMLRDKIGTVKFSKPLPWLARCVSQWSRSLSLMRRSWVRRSPLNLLMVVGFSGLNYHVHEWMQ